MRFHEVENDKGQHDQRDSRDGQGRQMTVDNGLGLGMLQQGRLKEKPPSAREQRGAC